VTEPFCLWNFVPLKIKIKRGRGLYLAGSTRLQPILGVNFFLQEPSVEGSKFIIFLGKSVHRSAS
jgi:hypothetical protein